MEPGVHETAMIRDDIQHVAHIPLAESLAQRNQGLVAAEHRVHLAEIAHVVAVVGEGSKDWVQVKRVDAKLLKIVEVSFDASQVAAIKGHQLAIPGCLLTPREGFTGVTVARVGFFDRIVAGVAIGEAVREDLVKNGALQPGDRLKACQEFEVEHGKRCVDANTKRVQPPDSAFGLDRKPITHSRFIDLERSFPNAIATLLGMARHCGELLFAVGDGAKHNLVGVGLAGNKQANGDRFSHSRVGVRKVIGSGHVQHVRKPGGLR